MSIIPLLLFYLVALGAFPMLNVVNSQGFSMQMKTILSPELSIFPKIFTLVQKHQALIELSKDRYGALGDLYPPTVAIDNATTPINSSAVRFPVSRSYNSFFYAEVMVGTPSSSFYLVLDTTTSPTWVQCAQCRVCVPSASQNYNPLSSSSFRPMFYTHPICVPPFSRYNTTSYCSYKVIYRNGASSQGLFATDTFGFVSAQGQRVPVPNVAFGNGIYNYISFGKYYPSHPNAINGVIGLGRGHPSSLLQQLRVLTLEKFAYCLPVQIERTTLLKFGTDAVLSLQGRPNVQSTPIFGDPTDLYYLKMNGASLGGKVLVIKPNYLVMDSGTPFSILARDDYNMVRQEVVAYFRGRYGWIPLRQSMSGYDLCYTRRAGAFVLPWLTLHLHDADLDLSPARMFVIFVQFNEMCLLLLPGEKRGPNVLGAYQQANYRFLFDVATSKLSWAPETC